MTKYIKNNKNTRDKVCQTENKVFLLWKNKTAKENEKHDNNVCNKTQLVVNGSVIEFADDNNNPK